MFHAAAVDFFENFVTCSFLAKSVNNGKRVIYYEVHLCFSELGTNTEEKGLLL